MLALPLKTYAQLGMDSVANFAVYAGGSLNVTGTTTITGDVGLGPSGIQNFGTAFTINGTYLVDNTGNNSHGYSDANFSGGTVIQDIDAVGATVSSVSAYAAGLGVTTNFALTISGDTTIIGNSGTNVVSVPGFNLAGQKKLTLQGGANDVFIFNVASNIVFSGNARSVIVLSGGVTADHVLFNLLNTTASANALSVTAANITLFGTFIAPSASVSLLADTVNGGIFAGGNNLTLNGATVTGDIFALPEPSSFVLVGISCLFGLGLWSRRRHGGSA